MAAKIFDGKAFAAKKELELIKRVEKLRKRRITPTLACFLIGYNEASKKYIQMKKRAAERIGAQLDEYNIPPNKPPKQIAQLIKFISQDKAIHGIMIQLPLPKAKMPFQKEFIDAIDPKKDVDGLREDSLFTSATVKAVITILEEANFDKAKKITVTGARGEVGRRLIEKLKTLGYPLIGTYDKRDYPKANNKIKPLKAACRDAYAVVSATGSPKLVTSDIVRRHVVLIDVGFPEGDIDLDSKTIKKARFATPVPGGVGPVTVISLLENLVEAAEEN